MVDRRTRKEAVHLRGWFKEPYRHALAARGITLKSRDDLDYALHKRGKIYPGEYAQYFWYDIVDFQPGFNEYIPAKGEIYNLKLFKELLNVFDRRKFQTKTPISPQEEIQIIGIINEFTKKIDISQVGIGYKDYIEEVHNLLQYYRNEGKTVYLILAVDVILAVIHHNKNALEKFLETNYTGGDRTVTGVVAKEAMDLQRGSRGEVKPGEGQYLIDIWIEELDRRRLT